MRHTSQGIMNEKDSEGIRKAIYEREGMLQELASKSGLSHL